MLTEIDKILSRQCGLALVEHPVELSPAFVFVHFISNFMKEKGNVIYVSAQSSADFIRYGFYEF